jgi:hypothetical protein
VTRNYCVVCMCCMSILVFNGCFNSLSLHVSATHKNTATCFHQNLKRNYFQAAIHFFQAVLRSLKRAIDICVTSPTCSAGDHDEHESHLLLHGRLYIKVIAAKDLPDTDTAFFNIDKKDKTDPYVSADLGSARLFKTRYIANDLGRDSPNSWQVFRTISLHVPITFFLCFPKLEGT